MAITSTGATWECPGCPTACKIKVPLPLPAITLPIPPLPKFPPNVPPYSFKMPVIPPIPNPPFDFATTCPSSGRKD